MGDILRPYQSQGIHDIFDKWRSGMRSVLFQMPTGTGKTVLFSEIVKKGYDHNRKILIVAHRKELIEQIVRKLFLKQVDVGVIIAGKKADYSMIVQVASIQTLTRREHPEANLIIIDECHHAKAKSYKKLWTIYPGAKFLGVTATPIRLSGAGFKDLFDVLVPSMQINDFIRQGYLSPIKHFSGATPNLKGVKKRQGDYINNELSKVMLQNDLMANLLDSYQKLTPKKSTIVFAVNIEHSKSIAERYKHAGIRAAHIDSKTPHNERKKILQRFKAKEIQVISNVEIITEGFDFPECEVVQLARPTKSLALYLQMVGRVMRIASGKHYGVVLDNAGLWFEHGLSTINRTWSLQGLKDGKNKKKITPKDVLAIQEEGELRDVNRQAPNEVEGLELIEVTDESQRLLIFETFLQKTIQKQYKIIASYFHYKDYLDRNNITMTLVEFEYIERRLNVLNTKVELRRKFKPSFWEVQKYKFRLGFK